MTVVYFIGNGFDLNIGLKTQFSDVLSSYIEETSSDIIIKAFKKHLEQGFNSWANFEEKMGLYTDEISSKETSIETFLDYQKCILDFKVFLKKYLQKEEKRVRYTDTQNIAKIFKASLFSFNEHLGIDPKIIMDEIEKNIIKFSYINFNYTSIFDSCLDILKKSNIFQFEKRRKTAFFGDMIYGLNDLGSVIHIHGTLDSDILLGVNDLKQIKNIDFHGLEKLNVYIKPKANDNLENHKNIDVIRLLNDANIYCIFGMSLGKTDKKWWIEIGRQLIKFPEKHLIIYAYDRDYDGSFPENTLEVKDYYKNKFFNHFRFSELDKDDLKNKIIKNIHVVINKDIFKLNLI